MSAPVTAQEFLRELLRIAPEGSVAWCCQFRSIANWTGEKTTPETFQLDAQANAYYSIALFPPSASARVATATATTRKIPPALGAGVVLADDVTTKGKADEVLRLFGEPSYKIRTSANSQQWGYFLERLATEEEIAPVHSKFLEMKLCDPSGNNPIRYGRLPGGINNKKEYGGVVYSVEMLEWHPERRFKIETIAKQLDAAAPAQATSGLQSSDEDDIETLAAAIEAGDTYHEPLNKLAAKYAVRGYPPADVVSMLRGHMLASPERSGRWQTRFEDIERTVRSAMKYAPVDRGEKIQLRAGRAKEAVEEAIAVLGRRGVAASIFARGEALVSPYTVERRGFDEERVSVLELSRLNPSALAHELNGLINFSVHNKRSKRPKPTDCPSKLANTLLSIPQHWRVIPRLDAIVSAPIYLGGGRLLAASGYHADRHVWLTVPVGVKVAVAPDRKAAEAALGRLKEWIEEFEFAEELDRSVMLAGMMTAAMRASLPAAPAFGFDAPEYGTGKSTAAKLVHIIGTGRLPAVMSYSENVEEVRKHIDAAMLRGSQSIVFDNVPTGTVLTSPDIATLLTEPYREARELGFSRTHVLPCTQLVLATGNNLQVAADMTRRWLLSRQDPRGDPTSRQFRRPRLLQEAQQQRAAILSDVFAIVAAYEASGGAVNMEPLPSYNQWTRWCVEPLIWLGETNPVQSTRRLQAEDPDRDTLDTALDLWATTYGDRWVGVKEMATYDRDARPEQRDACAALQKLLADECGRDREGNLDRRKVGHWLKRMRERWTPGGWRLEQHARGDAKTRASARWRVVAVVRNTARNGSSRDGVEGSEGSQGFYASLDDINQGKKERGCQRTLVNPQNPLAAPEDEL